MYRIVLVLLILCQIQPVFGAFERTTRGSRPIAMGGASVATVNNPWAAFSNPAALQTIPQRTVSFFYSPQPFGLSELARGSFSYVEPTSVGTFAGSASRYGFELYREIILGISYGMNVTDRFAVGLHVNYYSLSIQNYGNDGTIGVDAGFLVEVTDDIRWGFAGLNLNAPTIGEAKEKLPQVYSTGISYMPIREATLVLDIVKDIRYPAELHIGIEYSMFDIVDIRGGTSSDPSTLNAGMGLHYSFVQLDYAFSAHVDLGMTHYFSLSLLLSEL